MSRTGAGSDDSNGFLALGSAGERLTGAYALEARRMPITAVGREESR